MRERSRCEPPPWSSGFGAREGEPACRLLTEDLQDGQNLDGLVVMNPFALPDAELP